MSRGTIDMRAFVWPLFISQEIIIYTVDDAHRSVSVRRRVRIVISDYNNIVSLKNIIVTITKHYWDGSLTNRENIGNYFHA